LIVDPGLTSHIFTKDTWLLNLYPNDSYSLVERYLTDEKHSHSVLNPWPDIKYNIRSINNLIVNLHLLEVSNVYDDYTDLVGLISNKIRFMFPNLKNIYVLYQTAYFDMDKIRPNLKTDIEIIPIYFPLYMLASTTENKNMPIIDWTNSRNINKANWLVGNLFNSSTKSQRRKAELLFEFIKNNINCLEYSMEELINIETSRDTINYIEHYYGEFSLNDFKHKFYRKLKDAFYSLSGIEYLDGLPKDWNDYGLVIQTDSYFCNPIPTKWRHNDNYPLSEKIWKPIKTKKPFVAYSEYDQIYRDLRRMKFKTFLDYTDHPKLLNLPVESINDDNQRWANMKKYTEVTYSRTTSFLNNIEKYKEQIALDTEYNYNHLKNLSKQEWKRITEKCPPLGKHDMRKVCYYFLNWYDVSFITNPSN